MAADARAIAGQASTKVESTITITIDTQRPREAGVFTKASRAKMPKGHEALPGLLERAAKATLGDPSPALR